MDSSKINVDQLPNCINFTHSITYIGIGCSSHHEWSIEDDQQYPIFVRRVKEERPDLNINLILIDPDFTSVNPPLCTKSPHMKMDKIYTNVYHTIDNINVYVFGESIQYIPQFVYFTSDSGRDITSFLMRMNVLCNRNDAVLIVHDFSGLEIDVLALYFDNFVNKKHIMYDVSCRSGVACMIDFDNIYCQIRAQGNNIEIMNPFAIEYDDIINKYYHVRDPKLRKILCKCVEYHKEIFIKLYLNNLRRGRIWQLSKITGHDVDVNKRTIRTNEIKMLDHIHGTYLLQSLENNDSDKFMEMLMTLFVGECHHIGQIYHVSGKEFTKLIYASFNEPNYWNNSMKLCLESMKL